MRCRFTPVLPVLFLVLTGCILAPEVYESGSLHWAIEIADSEARGRHGDAYLYAVEGFGLGPGGLLAPDLGGEAVFTCDHYSPGVGWVIRVTVRYSGVEVYELQGGEEPRLG
ncbi:hypothetical protein KAU45_01415, partial [bacterium]|nr:hypothetical protein [bacterium]